MAARAAWLYHAGGLTQSAVARALGVNDVKAHRLLARAVRDGTVRVLVDGPIGGCIVLEDELRARFRLGTCRVVPELGEAGLPLRAIGQAGAAFLRARLESTRNAVVGVGHGRSLAACVQYLPRIAAPGLRLVSLLGGLPRLRTANPYEMIHLFAERTGADAWLVPVPFFANAPAERAVLTAQRGIAEAFALAREASLCLVGIGEATDGAFLRLSDAVTQADMESLYAAGAVGEMLGRYFDASGRLVRTELHARVIAAPLETLNGLTAIAGGPAKRMAILAALRSGLLDGLITDDATARFLLEAGTETDKGEQTWTALVRRGGRGDQQALRQAPADAVDQARRPPAPTASDTSTRHRSQTGPSRRSWRCARRWRRCVTASSWSTARGRSRKGRLLPGQTTARRWEPSQRS